MPHVIDTLFALIRMAGLYMAGEEVMESRGDYVRAKRARINGSRRLLSIERLAGSLLSLVVQLLLVLAIIWSLVWQLPHDHLLLSVGTFISVVLSLKAMVTRAARRKIDREPPHTESA